MSHIAAGVVGVLIGWAVGCFMWAPIVDFWYDQYGYYKTLYTYAYEGNIERGYQTLCDRRGHTGVWFVDECDAAPYTATP